MKKSVVALVSSLATAVLLIGAMSLASAETGATGATGELPQPPEPPSRYVLTDEQKAEIAALEDAKSEIDKQIIDKYAEFGAIDSETADRMKEAVDSRKENGGKRGFGKPEFGFGKPEFGFGGRPHGGEPHGGEPHGGRNGEPPEPPEQEPEI